jgi:hypothetical protein
LKLTGYRKDGRKTATRSPEVGRLPAVQARRNKLYGTAIYIVAQIELEVLLDAIDPQAPLGWGDDRLRDVATTRYFLENPPRQLVAAVRRLAAETGRRFEEPLLAAFPESFCRFREDLFGTRNAAGQQAPVFIIDADACQPLVVAEGHQIAFVGKQRMLLRVRGEDHGIGQIGHAQGGMLRFCQREIGQPVVNQVDAQSSTRQAHAVKRQLGRVGDHRHNAVRFE